MEPCNEDTAKFMAEALLNHAKSICRYAKTYAGPVLPERSEEREFKEKYAVSVERMIQEMYALMRMAKYKGIDRYCNREQVEAYMDETRMALEVPLTIDSGYMPQYN